MMDEVKDADAGWAAGNDKEGIKQAILKMIHEKASLKQKGTNALQLSKKYNWDANAKAAHEGYSRLLKGRNG
jgi:glycosyltransferase involved in cell wall biosynthesis